MKKIFALEGSPRRSGNSTIMLDQCLSSLTKDDIVYRFRASELTIKSCKGCLRCNVLGRCCISDDDWTKISKAIMDADTLIFSSPVYFLNFPASVKAVLDRFRSFVRVSVTENGLDHKPNFVWNKNFVLLLSLGSSSTDDARHIIEVFEHLSSILDCKNKFRYVIARRQVISGQILYDEEQLSKFYQKINLPANLAIEDAKANFEILQTCRNLLI